MQYSNNTIILLKYISFVDYKSRGFSWFWSRFLKNLKINKLTFTIITAVNFLQKHKTSSHREDYRGKFHLITRTAIRDSEPVNSQGTQEGFHLLRVDLGNMGCHKKYNI